MLAQLLAPLLAAQATASAPASLPPGPIPGQCAEPARDNLDREGCYLAGELRISDPPDQLYWHLFRFPDEGSARLQGEEYANSLVTAAHGAAWLHVLSGEAREAGGIGAHTATAGPMRLTPGRPVNARFLQAIFPPGMTTRIHSHSGPEAFYVLEGVQCVESEHDRRMIGAGEVYILAADAKHIQSSPSGRRNMAVVFHYDDAAWMTLEPDWQPSDFCLAPGSATAPVSG